MNDNLDIAIIGLACRFPGADDEAAFWRNLAEGVESITTFSDEELQQAGVSAAHRNASNYVKAAPVLAAPEEFDATFFGYVPAEARTIDPQQRILLELAYEAMENASCDPSRYPGRIGVFTGAAMNTYFQHAGLQRNFAEDYIPTLIGNDKDFLSTRISYKLNLKGPSITVQTACSTSLVAVHLARQSLLSGETDVAVAGAISVRVPHRVGYLADGGGVTSPDGHVRAFDAGANGTVFGSGGGVIILKRLQDALSEGDTIRAIIKGSAINNDGSEKVGYTAPSVNSQAEAVVEALANADVSAESVSYLEAHGSGTPVGDPIEIRALTKAFRTSTARAGFCAIGSVKTNVGHLDAAAGLAGLIKTVLALEHRQLPPSLHFTRPNPEIDFPATPFFVNTRLTPWASPAGPRRAGLLATGMGGTNACVILEEAPPRPVVQEPTTPHLFVLSARTESALAASAERLRSFLEKNPQVPLGEVAYSLQTGRRTLPYRRFLVAQDRAELLLALTAKPVRGTVGHAADGAPRPVVLLLPGVGDHYVGMGRELYTSYPTFQHAVDRCAEILRPLLQVDIRDILYPKNRDWQKTVGSGRIDLKKMLAGNVPPVDDDDTRRLHQSSLLQPALFTVEYALARLWMDLGIKPRAMVGHSMGEYVAACLAGVFSLEDALRLLVRRAQLVERLPAARMLAVNLPEVELQAILPAELSISLLNGPSLCVVAGAEAAIESFSAALTTRQVAFRPVQNTHAFHSRMLDPVVGAYAEEVSQVRINPPQIPFTSNVTGEWISAGEATDPLYWSRHLNHPARFHDALHSAWQSEGVVFLEAGPGRTLGVLAMQHPARPPEVFPLAVGSLRHHYESQSDLASILQSIGRLWLAGVEVAWEKLPASASARKVALPTYPFERQHHWIDPVADTGHLPTLPQEAPGTSDIAKWFYVPSWERTLFPPTSASPDHQDGVVWLIFCEHVEQAQGFRRQLNLAGASVVTVCLGDQFAIGPEGSCTLRAADPGDYLRLFEEVTGPAQTFRILHLGSAGSSSTQELGFFSLLYIAQALGELNIPAPVTLGVVTSQLHDVTGGEILRPQMATALGACGVIPKEFPNITCFSLDLPFAADVPDLPPPTCSQILSEFSGTLPDEVIAYRGPYRWRRKYDEAPLAEGPLSSRRLRPGGVYLITGGTGGVGLAIAQFLAQQCRSTLVLTRRSPFPEKWEWKSLLHASTTPEETKRILTQLLELETRGSQVEVAVADVTDQKRMEQIFTQVSARYGALHGVIHAAGIIQDGPIRSKTQAVAAAVLAPKRAGCDVIYALAQKAQPDFLALFSSTASILSPAGQIDYAAANAYLDAFSHFAGQQNSSFRTFTINWPGWREVGMLAELAPAPEMLIWKEEALQKAISTEDALEVFRRILDSDLPQVIVSPQPLGELLRGATGNLGKVSRGEDGQLTVDVSEIPENELEQLLGATWSDVLGVSHIDREESFFDLGGNSLLALQLVTKIRSLYDVEITLRDFFEAPTIARLGTLIHDKLLHDIAQMTDDEVDVLMAHKSR